ncbi:hypothetical protein AXF42_Ash001782 [Apostasia shenzhenica]|uniref:RING-type domain-containing protein n=1 Tax=Apostasia shenzhenica TaxID=1088818 RepID=A0A2I0AB73_9ASPA|nr:hypothetical protein AXF42_Ash001782 [Apostasia shenzhenica]
MGGGVSRWRPAAQKLGLPCVSSFAGGTHSDRSPASTVKPFSPLCILLFRESFGVFVLTIDENLLPVKEKKGLSWVPSWKALPLRFCRSWLMAGPFRGSLIERETRHRLTIDAFLGLAANASEHRKHQKYSKFVLGKLQILCTICLEPLGLNDVCSGSPAIFTAQCSHSFHLTCISSNVRHGSVTCPICRTHWHQLPRELIVASRSLPPPSASSDPILRILDDSIATSRVNRRSSLSSIRYNDDDPTDPPSSFPTSHCTRLCLSLSLPFVGSSARASGNLFVRLAPQQPTDFVIVVAPNGSHLRLLKQAIAFAVFSLRSADRLALVICSPAAASRAFALRRMSSNGKHAALQVIDRLLYHGEVDPSEGLQKAVRILDDRRHRNPLSCILHLSDISMARVAEQQHLPMRIHWFHVGFGDSNGLFMHEFEEFFLRLIGGEVREVELRVGNQEGVVRLHNLRYGEERKVPVDALGDCDFVYVMYNYREFGVEERTVCGEAAVGIGEKEGDDRWRGEEDEELSCRNGFRRSCVESWDYLDPFMARRWAKHLHGCRA